ncbi:MAG TPA: carbohydrate-binding family 9-like protein [Hanamia sp.]
MIYRFLFLLFVLSSHDFINAQSAGAVVKEDSILKIQKISDFEVTGDGTSQNWESAKWITLPQRKNDGAVYQTQMKLLYSDEGIYCLFKCDDKKITATLKGDFLDIYNEDVVEVFFWTDEKMPVYFEYELSPLNYELPILVPNNKGDFFGWRPWHYEGNRRTRHATRINMNKKENAADEITFWTAEFFIPFALLKPMANVPPKKGTQWRANFCRIDYDNGRSTWSWQKTRTSFHDYEKFGTVLFE